MLTCLQQRMSTLNDKTIYFKKQQTFLPLNNMYINLAVFLTIAFFEEGLILLNY